MKTNEDILVNILTPDIKIKTIKNVKIIRIKSEKYNLLIMKDYWPVIGEIKGSCYIESDVTVSLENIDAFYSLSHNVFNIIIKEV